MQIRQPVVNGADRSLVLHKLGYGVPPAANEAVANGFGNHEGPLSVPGPDRTFFDIHRNGYGGVGLNDILDLIDFLIGQHRAHDSQGVAVPEEYLGEALAHDCRDSPA